MISRESLKDYFVQGFKKPDNLQMGVEWEKIGVYRENGKAIHYSGPRGVETIFKALAEKYHWAPVFSGPRITALTKDRSSITLEPGGQIELSGRKAARLDDNASELYAHLKEIKEVSEPLGIVWLGLGLQPISTLEEIEWVPKERYEIMREKLKNKGSMTYAMMKQTASIQVSLDFTDEADAVEKLRLAMGLSPIFSAIFANSPVSEGKLNGFCSKRSEIWLNTDPDRVGMIEKIFEPDFTLQDYVDYALEVPLFFIVRQGQWIAAPDKMTFGEFLKKSWGEHSATPADWELHLTTLFTDARLKRYLEIRCLDCQSASLGLAACAFIKSIFYSPGVRKKAWGLVADFSIDERKLLGRQVPRKGLKTKVRNKEILELAVDLLNFSKEASDKTEKKYLEPLEELLMAEKTTPAEKLSSFLKNSPNNSFLSTLIARTAL